MGETLRVAALVDDSGLAALLAVAGVSAAGISDRLMTNWRFTSEPESVQGRNLLEEHLIGGDYPAHELVIIRSDSLTVDDPAFQERVMQVTGALADSTPSLPQ
ncbi:MAG: hypothetical protein R2849_09820 [Thermomicrobiales bacterium]